MCYFRCIICDDFKLLKPQQQEGYEGFYQIGMPKDHHGMELELVQMMQLRIYIAILKTVIVYKESKGIEAENSPAWNRQENVRLQWTSLQYHWNCNKIEFE